MAAARCSEGLKDEGLKSSAPACGRTAGLGRRKRGQRSNRWVQGEHNTFDELTSFDYCLQIISELRDILIKKDLLPV